MAIKVTQELLPTFHPLVRPDPFIIIAGSDSPLSLIPVNLCCYAYIEPSTPSEGFLASITTESTLLVAHCSATGRTSVSNAVAKGTNWSRYSEQLKWLTDDKKGEVELLLLAVPLIDRHTETIDLALESTLRSIAENLGISLSTRSIDLPPRAFSVQISKDEASTAIQTYRPGFVFNPLARFNEFNTYPAWLFFSYLAFFQWVVSANFGSSAPLWMIYDGDNKWRAPPLSEPARNLLKLATTKNGTAPRLATEDVAARIRHGDAMVTSVTAQERLPHMVGSIAAWGSWCAVCLRQDKLEKCAGCGWETYCGEGHQRYDWEYHKGWCKKNRKSTSS